MTEAEQICKNNKYPKEWQDGVDEIVSSVRKAFEEVELNGGKLVPAARYARDPETDEVILGIDGTPEIVLLEENGEVVMEPHPLDHRLEHHGLHAYRYEVCSDGSVVALYANDAKGHIKMRAFSSIEVASRWSPRLER